jgi:glycosyltransferase involved in cell wall biosynthesis
VKNVLMIDPLAGDIYHLVDDDLYLTECLLRITSNLEVLSSETSANNINAERPGLAKPMWRMNWLRKFSRLYSLARVMGVRTRGASDVFFQSFEELHIIAFKILHPRTRIHLIFTNNISTERSDRHPFIWKWLLRGALKSAYSSIVHSQYEENRVRTVAPWFDRSKIFITPFHQVGFDRQRSDWDKRKNVVLFMGPALERKPLQPLIDLIERDTEKRFNYVLRAMIELPPEQKEFFAGRSNVDVGYGYVDDSEYYELFSSSSLVMLTHNLLFEGKISGPFCDAIASGTPVIAADMSPGNEYFTEFGAMGYLVNFDDPSWSEKIINVDLASDYVDFQPNMVKCRNGCSLSAIREVFSLVLGDADAEHEFLKS